VCDDQPVTSSRDEVSAQPPAWQSFAREFSELAIKYRDNLKDPRHRNLRFRPNASAIAAAADLSREYVKRALDGTGTITLHDLERVLSVLKVSSQDAELVRASWATASEAERDGGRQQLPEGGGLVRAKPNQIARDGFVQIDRWSALRPLEKRNLEIRFDGTHRHNYDWDSPLWRTAREAFVAAGREGNVASIINVRTIDYRETESQDRLGLTLARIDYSTQLATRRLLEEDSALVDALRDALTRHGIGEFLDRVPPSAVAANINVLTSDNDILLAQRSSVVVTYPGQWNLGINETMNFGSGEDFFGLVTRGLQEEVGLAVEDIEECCISWLGYCLYCANFCLFAHARTSLATSELLDRASTSQDSYEHSEFVPVPFRSSELQRIVDREPAPDGSTHWLHHAPLSAIEVWRSRTLL
jgi:hypothetical protein